MLARISKSDPTPLEAKARAGLFQFEDTRFLDPGKDRVVALYRIVGRGAGSGVPVSQEIGSVWQLRNGKMLKGDTYLDQREALEVAGLSE
jgi:ketosteroid isomerase-like protein